MTRVEWMIGLSLLAGIPMEASLAAAQGGGSLGLDEVLDAVKDDARLVADIESELKTNGLRSDTVICSGFRHDNRWAELSGSRAAPYECDIGKRRIVIQADRVYFDAGQRSLGDMKRASPKQADSFKESNFRWTWKAQSKR